MNNSFINNNFYEKIFFLAFRFADGLAIVYVHSYFCGELSNDRG